MEYTVKWIINGEINISAESKEKAENIVKDQLKLLVDKLLPKINGSLEIFFNSGIVIVEIKLTTVWPDLNLSFFNL